MLKEEVTEETSPRWCPRGPGIPVTNLREGEREKLIKMEERLGKRVIGSGMRSPPWRMPSAARAQGSAG
jgi:ATP-dependent Clp protease ATP-binding subunit ClpB